MIRNLNQIFNKCDISQLNMKINLYAKFLLFKFGNIYYKVRYLNTFKVMQRTKEDMIQRGMYFQQPTSPLLFTQAKYSELFEGADKAKYQAAALISIDSSELGTVDSYKDGYPYTSTYSKFLAILNKKQFYFLNTEKHFQNALSKCFDELENYNKVYETISLFSSFAEEIKLFIQRVHLHPKVPNLKWILAKNDYDTEERLHKEIQVLLDHYKKVYDSLNDYPLWQKKFEADITKQFAFANCLMNFPEIFSVINQQKIFK